MAKPTKKNIEFIQITLLDWYSNNGRFFAWRNLNLTAYQLIIAETLLQRTKAETISNFYAQFLHRFPNWDMLANTDSSVIEKFLKPIGLQKQRASRLKNLAVEMAKLNYKLPEKRVDLESLPFFGQYITNAIELLIYRIPRPLIDVNMTRVIERFFEERQLVDIRYDPHIQNVAQKLVDHPQTIELNWAILDFAALVCKSRNPLCLNCPLNIKCSYYNINKSRMTKPIG